MTLPTLADRFEYMVAAFTAGPAPLYRHLASCAAEEVRKPGPFQEALQPFAEEPPRRLFVLRLFGVIHRAVLAGELPDLARHYPSAGGTEPPEGSWPLFRAAVLDRADRLPELLDRPHQHNEPTRAAALAGGFMLVARQFGLPLRLLEVGASAGFLLRWDHYLDLPWFHSLYEAAPPLEGGLVVAERRGCDLFPIDPTTRDGELTLKSLVWADLADHVRVVEDAIQVARRVPATVEAGDGAEWLTERLAEPAVGVTTVVYHSLMRAAGPQESLARMDAAIREAGRRATSEAPVAHLRFETDHSLTEAPAEPQRLVKTTLTAYPGGEDLLLATSDVNGRHVHWVGPTTALVQR